ncbi:hypothetical protein Tco_1318618 [Tanacetum coccineum]
MTAKSKTINNVRYITATVAGKPVSISEASIRSDLQFNDAVGLMCYNSSSTIKNLKLNQAQRRVQTFISHHKLGSKSVPIKKIVRKISLKTKLMQNVSVIQTVRKPAKSEPTVHKDQAFDDLDDAMDYMEIEDAHDEGTVKDSEEIRVSIEDQVSTHKLKVSTDKPNEGPILTLKALPKIEPKDKGKKVLEEKAKSDAESEGVNEAERKFAQLANDEEIAKSKLNADKFLEKASKREREKFTIEQRASFLHDTNCCCTKKISCFHKDSMAIRKKTSFLYEITDKPKMTYLKIIRELNKKAAGTKKADSIKEESKEEAGTRKRKLGTRKKMKSRKRRFRHGTSEDEKENDELKLCLTIAPDEDKEVDYEILDRKYPIIEWKTEYLGIKPQFDETKGLEESNLNVVIRSNGQRRYFSTLMRVLSIFDREDLNVVYKLVMDRYQNEVPEGFDRVLWGDLMIMFNPNDEDEFWNTQQDWNVVSWKLHRSSGVHTLMTDTGLVIHMLVEKKYPLKRKVLLQMLELKLESEEDSTMALELIRFVKKLIAELEPEDSDGNEEDL